MAAFARVWREQQAEAARAKRGTYVPLVFAPGEAFQFDWSEDWAVVGRERQKLSVAHFKLSHSRAFMLRAYPLQTHEMLFDAHNHALAALGGVPRRGIYDNMKTAVDKIGRGKARTVNARFHAMTGHFLFEADFCNPASGWEKGQIEKNVRDARPRIWHEVPKFADFGALNAWLEHRCIALWAQIRHPEQTDRTVAEVWDEERAQLMAMPPPFDGFVEETKRVSPTCLVSFDRNRYSVPHHGISGKGCHYSVNADLFRFIYSYCHWQRDIFADANLKNLFIKFLFDNFFELFCPYTFYAAQDNHAVTFLFLAHL